ncbi:hypothetical protein ACFQZ4_32120 [Catellatospora coxensis]
MTALTEAQRAAALPAARALRAAQGQRHPARPADPRQLAARPDSAVTHDPSRLRWILCSRCRQDDTKCTRSTVLTRRPRPRGRREAGETRRGDTP